jgi:hypothetical protein
MAGQLRSQENRNSHSPGRRSRDRT